MDDPRFVAPGVDLARVQREGDDIGQRRVRGKTAVEFRGVEDVGCFGQAYLIEVLVGISLCLGHTVSHEYGNPGVIALVILLDRPKTRHGAHDSVAPRMKPVHLLQL